MHSRITSGLLAVAIATGGLATLRADDDKPASPKRDAINREAGQRDTTTVNKPVADDKHADQKSATALHRATEINGAKVVNGANKELGSIKDVVIELEAGKIRYAALSYGGFLGLGDKLFAVPWDALQHRHDVSNGDHYFVLNIDEATLKRSEGFDSDHWPNFADPAVASQIDKFYEKYRHPHQDARDGDVRKGAQREANTDRQQAVAKSGTSGIKLLRASTIMDMDVRNEGQKDLGDVEDLVIDCQPGKIRYAALSYGGFLGLGDKLFAVPWQAFQFRHDLSDKESFLVLNVDESRLRKASGFDKDHWPNFADPSITREIDKHYEVSATRTKEGSTEGAIVREREKE